MHISNPGLAARSPSSLRAPERAAPAVRGGRSPPADAVLDASGCNVRGMRAVNPIPVDVVVHRNELACFLANVQQADAKAGFTKSGVNP